MKDVRANLDVTGSSACFILFVLIALEECFCLDKLYRLNRHALHCVTFPDLLPPSVLLHVVGFLPICG